MKRQVQFVIIVGAILCMNIPLSAPRTGSRMEISDSSGVFRDLLMYGAGVRLFGEEDDASGFFSLKSLFGIEIPAINYLAATPPEEDPGGEPAPPSQPGSLAADDSYIIDRLDYSKVLHEGSPLVVIYSTHTTESYQITENPSSWRSKNRDIGVVSVARLISITLHDEYGIQVLHITDIFDDPYEGAYGRSYDALEAAVREYPSIKYVIDVHRDGLSASPVNRAAYYTEFDGKPAAKVSTVLGVKSSYTAQNKKFEEAISSRMQSMYPGLFKRYIPKEYYYNQYLIPNSILLEVGSNLTTPEEARFTAVLLGRVLGETIHGGQ